jgi:hypothetical protein
LSRDRRRRTCNGSTDDSRDVVALVDNEYGCPGRFAVFCVDEASVMRANLYGDLLIRSTRRGEMLNATSAGGRLRAGRICQSRGDSLSVVAPVSAASSSRAPAIPAGVLNFSGWTSSASG